MYTAVYFHPRSREAAPEPEFIRDVIAFFDAKAVSILSGRNRPDLWDIDYYEPVSGAEDGGAVSRSPTDPADVTVYDAPVEKAFDLCKSGKFRVVHVKLPFAGIARGLAGEITSMIPISARAGHVSWDVNITCGPWSEPNWNQTATAASGAFRIAISGDNLPSDPAEYLRLFKELPTIVKLRYWLKQQTGLDWDIGLSLT